MWITVEQQAFLRLAWQDFTSRDKTEQRILVQDSQLWAANRHKSGILSEMTNFEVRSSFSDIHFIDMRVDAAEWFISKKIQAQYPLQQGE